MSKTSLRAYLAVFGIAGTIVGAAVVSTSPPAAACSNVVNGGGGGLGNGGSVQESCLPNGDKYHCETVYVLGFGGTNCFVIVKGDPRNP